MLLYFPNNDEFVYNFQKLLTNMNNCKPSLSVVTGDFNSDVPPGGLLISKL